MKTIWLTFLLSMGMAVPAAAQSDGGRQFVEFIRARGAELLEQHGPPGSLDEWSRRRSELRQRLQAAWGSFPTTDCPLAARTLGVLKRDGYRVEKVVFQTRPGIWMTANAYVPDQSGKLPAVLCVHGHWRGAKQDPVVQARCIGLAQHGFFVLVVDAFGAGERGVGKALGEYHGEMVGATLLPIGLPLSGLQVYENLRAIDYLCSRTEVDAERIGITGASGGGNQSEYTGGWDERIDAVVPVCSVGTARAALQVAACMCEIVPGKLRFASEWSVLGLSAPRGLLVINATRDGIQFSVAEAKKSLAAVAPLYRLYGSPDSLRHAVFESGHDYNREMREAMYGWMTRHLKGAGDGSPLAEPEVNTEEPEALRCFPGDSRPDDFVTLPQFAAAEAERILSQRAAPANGPQWQQQAAAMRTALRETVFGGDATQAALNVQVHETAHTDIRELSFVPEPGLELTARQENIGATAGLAIVLDLAGGAQAAAHPLAQQLRDARWSLVTLDLRATGQLAYDRDRIRRAPDHNTAEWSMLIGRPLLGQWVHDVRRCLDAVESLQGRLPNEVAVVGLRAAGVVALCSAALDQRITRVAAINTLGSYVSDVPYEGQRMGIMAPNIVPAVGDIAHLAALVLPRRIVVGGAVAGGGSTLSLPQVQQVYQPARQVARLLGVPQQLVLLNSDDLAAIAGSLTR